VVHICPAVHETVKILLNIFHAEVSQNIRKCVLGFISEFINETCLLILRIYNILYVFEIMFI